jgi:recombination associated protein RdgC
MTIKLFRDVLAYQLTQEVDFFDRALHDQLNAALATKPSRQPTSQEFGTFGFVEPVGEEGAFIERLSDGSIYIRAQLWKRDLPASVVNRELAAKIRKIETDESRTVYAKEKRQFKEEIIQKLLPRAFIKGKTVAVLIRADYLFVDTASAKLAEELLSLLRSVLGTLPIRPVSTKARPVAMMTAMLQRGDTQDENFTLGENFQAKGANDEASTVSGKNVDLSEDEIRELLDHGRQVTQLGLGWKVGDPSGAFFTLTEDLVLKGINWPESMADQASDDAGEEAEHATLYRATLLLVADALGNLFADVVEMLGGREHDIPGSDFEDRMVKAARAVAKNIRSVTIGGTEFKADEDFKTETRMASTREGQSSHLHTFLADSTTGEEDISGDDEDSLYLEALAFVRESSRASISAIQRHLKIGYNRAARMIEQMELDGHVTEMNSNGGRVVTRAAKQAVAATETQNYEQDDLI